MKGIIYFIMIALALMGCTNGKGGTAEQSQQDTPAKQSKAAENAKADLEGNTPKSEAILGDWLGVSGTDWEEISFDEDGNFFSYLHSRPYESGKWEIIEGLLKVQGESGEKYIFISMETAKNTISLRMKNGNVWVLKNSKAVIVDDVKANIQGYFNGMVKFTGLNTESFDPKESEWYDGKQLQKFSGFYAVFHSSKMVTPDGRAEISRQVFEYFRGIGFESDGYNTTEIFDGITDGKYAFKVEWESWDEEATLGIWGFKIGK